METSSQVPDRNALAPPSVPNPFPRRLARRLLGHTAHQVPDRELGRSAVVFSPHPDDESLGCGGTILRKKRAGATVKLVQVSDGGGSTTLIPRDKLAAMRKQESLNAGRVLGVDDTYFLEFPDGHLGEHVPAAIERVAGILRQESPQEVFVPYGREPMKQAADHVAVTNIVLAALQRHPNPVTVWEYPVWFWLHWPWVGFSQSAPPLQPKHIWKNSLLAHFGARAFLDLKYKVNIVDVLQQKRAAIAEHKSQMERLIDHPSWITLEQLSNGELMDCFYQEYEFFRCYLHGGDQGANRSGI
jgi:LmbE family N-acetylglucosaminyl deacetylase